MKREKEKWLKMQTNPMQSTHEENIVCEVKSKGGYKTNNIAK